MVILPVVRRLDLFNGHAVGGQNTLTAGFEWVSRFLSKTNIPASMKAEFVARGQKFTDSMLAAIEANYAPVMKSRDALVLFPTLPIPTDAACWAMTREMDQHLVLARSFAEALPGLAALTGASFDGVVAPAEMLAASALVRAQAYRGLVLASTQLSGSATDALLAGGAEAWLLYSRTQPAICSLSKLHARPIR